MYRTGLMSLALLLLGSSLAGCQLMPNSEVSVQPKFSAHTLDVLESPMPKGLISLHCTGEITCEFGKLNNTVLLNEITKQPTKEAINQSLMRFESGLASNPITAVQQSASKYFVTMPPGKHEVKMRFYTITPTRAENFILIHNFVQGKSYQLSMFRHRDKSGSTSVLNMATPEPLCVQLLEDKKVVRQFCRPFDPTTGLGEFIEQRVTSS